MMFDGISALFYDFDGVMPDNHVFVDQNGVESVVVNRGDGYAIARFKEAGIDHGSIHRIRRTVSSMLNQVLPQKDVAALLGHTEKVNEMYYNYSTADVKAKKEALSRLSLEVLTKAE